MTNVRCENGRAQDLEVVQGIELPAKSDRFIMAAIIAALIKLEAMLCRAEASFSGRSRDISLFKIVNLNSVKNYIWA